jgi:MFS family permease
VSSPTAWQDAPHVVAAQRRTLRCLVLAQVFGAFGLGASASVGVLLVQDVVASEWWAGIARTLLTLGAALFGLPLARLAVRRGRRTALGLGWCLAGLGAVVLVLAAISRSAGLVLGGMTLFGAGTAAQLQSRFTATDLAPPQRRGRTLAMVVWTGTVGTVVGPNLGVPGTRLAATLGIPDLAGAFVIAAATSVVAMLVLVLGLRPDPLLLARSQEEHDGPVVSRAGVLRTVWAIPAARFAVTAMVASHVSMVALMTMTPVHMDHEGATLGMVGLTISAHVLGMFAFAPLVGWAGDRFGAVPVVLAGQAVFAASGLLTLLVGHEWATISAALFLLGLGWSCATVSGSVLLSAGVPEPVRVPAQGTLDTTMNLLAAAGAFVSGPVFVVLGFSGLAVGVVVLACLVALAALPVLGGVQTSTGSRPTS